LKAFVANEIYTNSSRSLCNVNDRIVENVFSSQLSVFNSSAEANDKDKGSAMFSDIDIAATEVFDERPPGNTDFRSDFRGMDQIQCYLTPDQLVRFSRVPFGPLSCHIPNKNKELLLTADGQDEDGVKDAKDFFKAFLVNSHKDEELLSSLLPSCDVILIQRYLDKMYDIKSIIDESYCEMLSDIDVNVVNCLIDQTNICNIVTSKKPKYALS